MRCGMFWTPGCGARPNSPFEKHPQQGAWALGMQSSPVAGTCPQFLLRGLEQVNWEWQCICAGHSQFKFFRSGAGGSSRVRDRAAALKGRPPHGTATHGIYQLLSTYTHQRRPGTVAVGWSQLHPYQSAIPQTGRWITGASRRTRRQGAACLRHDGPIAGRVGRVYRLMRWCPHRRCKRGGG